MSEYRDHDQLFYGAPHHDSQELVRILLDVEFRDEESINHKM